MDAGRIYQRGAEAEAGGGIMISTGDHDPGARVSQPHQSVFAQRDGIQRRHCPVVNVAADQDSVDPL